MSNVHKTYFQKIGNSEGRAPMAVVVLSTNPNATHSIPNLLRFFSDIHYDLVSWIGKAFVVADVVFAFHVPRDPVKCHEAVWGVSPTKPMTETP